MGLVQHASATTGTNTGSTSLTATLGNTATVGNCLIVCVTALNEGGGAPTISSVHLGGSADNFAVAKSSSAGSAGIVAIYTDQNLQISSASVAVAVSGASAINLDVYEWSLVKASGAVDKTNSGTTSASGTFSSGSSGTLSQASEVAFGVVGVLGSSTITIVGPGASWTNSSQLSTNDSVIGFPYAQMSGYQAVSATTALTYNGTQTAGSFTDAAIVTLETVAPPPIHIRPSFQAVKRAASW